MTNEEKDWIDNATYDQLLWKWRFTDLSEAIFQGACGTYFAEVMAKHRMDMSAQEKVATSKRVGWDL